MGLITETEELTFECSYGRPANAKEIAVRNRRRAAAISNQEIVVGQINDCVACYYWLEVRGQVGRLLDFYVDKEYRGRGLSDELLAHAANSAKESGLEYLELTISNRNYRSVRFFLRHGAMARDNANEIGLQEYGLSIDAILSE